MSVRFIRLTALTLVCALLLCLIPSCGKSNKKNFVLRTFSTFGAEADLPIYSEIISQFTKQHKNVIINDTTTDQANSYKMELSIASTYKGINSPDVVYFSAMSDMSELEEYFVTVDEIRKDYPDFASGVSEAVLDSVAADNGNRYCIPVRGNWQGIVVNAALFRRSGLNIPETWSDILKAANHFKKGDVYLFANSLDECNALIEYLVRGIGGSNSLKSAMNGNPDSAWTKALDTIEELDSLSAFPPMSEGPYDYLISSSDLKNTVSADEKASAIDLYNSGKAAILLMDNNLCDQIDADIDSNYIMLPSVNTKSDIFETTTLASSTTSTTPSGTTTTTIRRTLPITQPSNKSSGMRASGTSDNKSSDATDTASSTKKVSESDTTATTTTKKADADNAETGLYVNFAEGFYITKRAYYNEDKREDILAFIECFLREENCVKFCNNYQVPSLASISKNTADTLTEKSNIYNAVINSVESADSFIVTTQTHENSFFWNHCEMSVLCFAKGILSKSKALKIISNSQLTVADVFKEK